MKLRTFFLAIWLTCVLALVPHYDRRRAVLPPGAYLEDDHIVLNPIEGRDDLPYYEDPYVYPNPNTIGRHPGDHDEVIEPPSSTGWDSMPSTNLTASNSFKIPVAADFPSEPKSLYVEARVGNGGQPVGTLRKKRLEKAIYECLNWSCPLDDPKRGMNACTQKNTKSCRVNNIVYNVNSKNPKYATNAWITIYVNYAFHNPAWPGIGEAAYRAVASLFRLTTETESATEGSRYFEGSCATVNFPWSRATKLCNTVRSASVGFPVNADHPNGDTSEVQAMAAVDIYFNANKLGWNINYGHTNGAFDKAVQTVSQQEWLPRFAEAIGRPQKDLATRLNYNAPEGTCASWWWYENEKCKSQ